MPLMIHNFIQRQRYLWIIKIYFSEQFILYLVFGAISATLNLSSRYIMNLYMSFSIAVVLSSFIGMLTAILFYRRFVFDAKESASRRQVLLFMAAYVTFLPVTWSLSVGIEGPLLGVLSPDPAHLIAHTIGIGVPVVLNFAFNKFVTFRDDSGSERPA